MSSSSSDDDVCLPPPPVAGDGDSSDDDADLVGDGTRGLVDKQMEDAITKDMADFTFGECAGCGKQIVLGDDQVNAGDDVFHEECLKCITCNIRLVGRKYAPKNGGYECGGCHVKALLDKTSCAKCSQAVDAADMIIAKDRAWHKACLVCSVCQCSLAAGKGKGDSEGIHIVQGALFCSQHVSSVPAAAAAAAANDDNDVSPALQRIEQLKRQQKMNKKKRPVVEKPKEWDLKEVYSVEELKANQVHSSVDKGAKEKYLSDDDFARLFKTDRQAFASLPKWKRDKQKKQHDLF